MFYPRASFVTTVAFLRSGPPRFGGVFFMNEGQPK